MLPSTEREVVQYEVAFDLDPPGRMDVMVGVAELLIKRVQAGDCVSKIDNERLAIAITTARFHELDGDPKGGLALLFDLVDPLSSVAANRHMTTRKLRTFDRLADEGGAVSAHMLLRLKPRQYGNNRFDALLESAVGLGRSRITPHLQRQFKAVFKDNGVTVEDADGKPQPALPSVRMSAVRSDRLKGDIQDAEVAELVLVQANIESGQFDPPDITQVQRREMRLKVKAPSGMGAAEILKRVAPWGKENGFDQIQVSWRPKAQTAGDLEQSAGTRYNRAKIDLHNADIGETLFAKRHFVTLDSEMPLCVEAIRDDMIREMAALV